MANLPQTSEVLTESKKDRHLRLMTERLIKIEHDFADAKDGLYTEKLKALKNELQEVERGTHPEYLERIQLLQKEKDFFIQRAILWREFQLKNAEQVYMDEKQAAEQEYYASKDGLKEKLLQQIDERKRKLLDEKESLTIDSDMQSELRSQQRKLRKRGAESSDKLAGNNPNNANNQKKKQAPVPFTSHKLKDYEIAEDFNIISKAQEIDPILPFFDQHMDETSLKKLKVQELKNLLSEKGLPQTGKKEELIQRLLESAGNQSEEAKVEDNDEGSSNQHTNEQTDLEVTIPEGDNKEENANKTNEDAKSPTTSGMTEEEKRIARAKRFGIEVKPANVAAPTDPVKKAAGPAIPKPAKAVVSKLGEDEEKLKKRAERFGNVTKAEPVEDPASKKPRTEISE